MWVSRIYYQLKLKEYGWNAIAIKSGVFTRAVISPLNSDQAGADVFSSPSLFFLHEQHPSLLSLSPKDKEVGVQVGYVVHPGSHARASWNWIHFQS